ncbi:hypothetical protein MMC17_008455 [Xylographa soralifera]|nr:hypothetical protein [Xylographa soralifera]
MVFKKAKNVAGSIPQVFSKDLTTDHDDATKELHRESLTRFILNLSDQKLVTGLAILIAALYQRCQITGVEYEIVFSLAWFSSTTHLATFLVLRDYLKANPFICNLRTTGVICMSLLLFHAMLINITLSEYNAALMLQCILNDFFSSLEESLMPSQWIIGQWVVNVSSNWNVIYLTVTICYLLSAYRSSLVGIYVTNESGPFLTLWRWMDQYHWRLFMCRMPGGPKLCNERSRQWHEEVNVKRHVRSHKGRVERLCTRSKQRTAAEYLHTVLDTISIVLRDFFNSFLWQIAWLWFGLSFGSSQVVYSRWYSLDPESDSSQDGSIRSSEAPSNINELDFGFRPDFGQITALLLLCLPFFTVVETLNDARQTVKSKTQPQHANSMPYCHRAQAAKVAKPPDPYGETIVFCLLVFVYSIAAGALIILGALLNLYFPESPVISGSLWGFGTGALLFFICVRAIVMLYGTFTQINGTQRWLAENRLDKVETRSGSLTSPNLPNTFHQPQRLVQDVVRSRKQSEKLSGIQSNAVPEFAGNRVGCENEFNVTDIDENIQPTHHICTEFSTIDIDEDMQPLHRMDMEQSIGFQQPNYSLSRSTRALRNGQSTSLDMKTHRVDRRYSLVTA